MTQTAEPLMRTDLPLPGRREGKVRDIYEAQTTEGREALLIIASDRISAFDVVMPNGIPGKGAVLTQISRFWFEMIAEHFGDRLEHHLLSTDPADIAGLDEAQVGPEVTLVHHLAQLLVLLAGAQDQVAHGDGVALLGGQAEQIAAAMESRYEPTIDGANATRLGASLLAEGDETALTARAMTDSV